MQVEQKKLNKLHVQRQFDRSAARYEQAAGMQKMIVDELQTLATSREGLEQILDAGCGTGYGLQVLKKIYCDAAFTGLDLSPVMLQMAKKNYPFAQFQQGDVEQLPFRNNVFDLTWSSSAIQWCDTQRAIDELTRVTRVGGEVLLSTFSSGTLKEWRDIWSLNDSKRFDSEDRVRSAFVRVGLKNVRLTTKVYVQEFTDFKSAVDSIRGIGAGNAEKNRAQGLLGVDQYHAIKDKVNKIISQRGKLELPYYVTFVAAEKATYGR